MKTNSQAIASEGTVSGGGAAIARRRHLPMLGALLLNLLVAGLCVFLLWQSRLGELADAQARVVNLSRLVELNVSSTLDKAGIALSSTATQIERQLTEQGVDQRALWNVVDAETAQVPEILRIGVFDVQGQQICASQEQRCLNLDVSGRDYFQRLKGDPTLAMKLYGPYLNKVDGQSSLVLARALRRPDGSFVGVAAAIIPVRGLQAVLSAVDVGSGGRAGLRSESLGLLSLPPGPSRAPDELAKLSKLSAELVRAVRENPNEGTYRALSGFDNVDRQAAYRHLPKYPLYVLVGLATTDFLTPWRQTAAWTAGFLLLFAATSLVIVRLILSGMKRQEKVQALLAQVTESEDRLRSLYETTPAMLHAVDLEGRLVVVSDAWLAKLGYARFDVLGRLSVDFFTEASRQHVLPEALPALMDKGRQDNLELQMVTRAGDVIDVLLSANVERSLDGTPLRVVAGLQDVTLRRRAELALDQERLRLQNIIEGTGAGTWQSNLITGEDSVNLNYAAMLGYTLEEFRQAASVSFMELVHPEDRPGVSEVRQAHVNGKTAAYETEFRMQHRDGHWIWVFSRGSVFLRDDQGRPVAIAGIHLDITSRKDTERQLNRERKQLANILEGTNVGTWEWNVETGECKFNERWADICGDTLANMGATTIETWSGLTHAEDRSSSSAQLERHFNGELPYYEAEIRVRHKDGHWVWVLDRGKLFSRSNDGRPRWMAGTRLDITKRKLAEEVQRDFSERFELAAESAGIGVWEFEPATGKVQWDDRMFRLYGSLRSEGHRPKDLWFARVHGDDLSHVKAALQQAVIDSRSSAEFRIVWPGGEIHYLSAHAQAVRNAQGETVRIIGVNFDITDRRVSEDRLRASKAFLDSAGRVAGVGGWMVDVVSGEIEWTDETCRIHNVPSGFKPSMDQAISFYAPDARPQIEKAVAQALATARGWDLELPLITASGRSIWVRAIGEVVAHGGKVVRLVGAFQDITARRALEAELRMKNEVMSSILENLPCGLSVFDRNLELVASNTEYRKLLGFPDELFEPAKPRFEDFIRYNAKRGEYGDGDIEQTVQAIVERAKLPAVQHRFERVRPNGLPVEVQGAPMPNGGFVTTYTDISERKRAELALQQRERLMRLVIDSFPGPLAHWDTDMRCTIANRAYRDWMGLDPEQMIGRTQRELIGAELYERNEPHILAALRGEEQRVERSRVVSNGSMRHFFLHYMPDRDGEHVRGFISAVVDVSDMKQVQLQLQDRTAQAEQANVAKSQFLANMSHEIRTPMNAILGMLALLKKTDLTPRQADYAGKSEGAARSLLGLLNDILDFSKAEAGKMTLDPHPFRMDQLLRDLSVILSANASGKNIEVLFDIDPKLRNHLLGDAMRLQQVLINLGGNAIKFTQAGEVVVSVEMVAPGDTTVVLEIGVRDSGIGIATEHHERIFSGFTQAEASTTRRFGGTGLGLAICQRLVALMGGTLRMDSTVGKGSRFYFRIELPLAPATLEEERLEATGRASVSLRALIIDDNPVARDVAKRMALALGWTADLANSGEAGLSAVRGADYPYDAVFVDWQMPGLDGWQTARRIRDIAGAGTAPTVVMMTAHGRDTLAQRTPEEQALIDGFLVKPVTASMLYDVLVDARAGRNPQAVPVRTAFVQLSRLAGLRLLVAEDNANNQQVARELLEDEGAEVVIAVNGLEAVEAVAAADPPFDAVLMDLQMPVMDGYTATSRIRQELARLDLPIVAMTANAMASDREACLSAGMNEHVGKPFDLDHLVGVLRRLVGRSAAAALAKPGSHVGFKVETFTLEAAAAAGVEFESALRRLGGNRKVYGRTLRDFVKDLASLPGQLKALLEGGAWIEAARELHSLRGVAATVGALALSRCAGEAESALAADPSAAEVTAAVEDVSAFIGTALQQLTALCAMLDADNLANVVALPTAMGAPPLTTADSEVLSGVLATVCTMLAASDLGAIETLKTLRTRVPAAAGPRLDALDEAVESLDFETALTCCNDWLKDCKS
ncbi:MAG: PAS domain-containing protein [Caldimonas sp.]